MTTDRKVEAEIDALLSTDDTESVIDTLLAMPHAVAASDQTWEKVLHARLQARLARRMREMLEGEREGKGGRKDSKSAA